VAIWSPNVWEWVVAVLGLQSAGGVLVPINTRYKGARRRTSSTAAGARLLVTVNGFLGNDYVGMLDGFELPHLERTVILRATCPTAPVVGDFVASGAGWTERGRRAVAALTPTRVRHPLHERHHREPEGRRVHPRPGRAGLRRLGRRGRACATATATS
jgi:hypothetical protein